MAGRVRTEPGITLSNQGSSISKVALLRLGRQLGNNAEAPILHDDTGYSVGLMSDDGEVNLVEHFDGLDESEAYAKWLSAAFGVPWSHAK